MLKGIPIILASSSPRRKELLKRLGWKFSVIPATAEETRVLDESPSRMVTRLSELKGRSVAAEHPDSLVIASDTTVAVDGEIFGKPRDLADAQRMLRCLSGRLHHVYSGLSVSWQGRALSGYDVTEVTFRELGDDDINGYIATGEPWGKAGAYAIQGRGSLLVNGIRGDYTTVVGLPVALLGRIMVQLGFSLSEILEEQK